MKKYLILLCLGLFLTLTASAQKFALVDMENIMSNIPAYESANEQLNQTSKKWQAEVEAMDNEAKTLYKNYQNEAMEAIVNKEKEASELRKKYFGPEGELYKKRVSLIQPIQDEIYNAVKSIAQSKGFQLVMDRASSDDIIFASPAIDISNEVLAKLGYSN